ncbi:hypothetical protein MyNCGM121_36450 [Achromobacter xylosoxidans]
MNKEQLDAIANRKTTCHPFGETVSISRAERDQLVALAMDGLRYRWLRDPQTDVALVLDKRTGYVPENESVPGVGGYYMYEYRAGEELDAAIDAAMPAHFTKDAECNCAACRPHSVEMRMILCSTCGNKRCPHATDHRNPCTGSNEPGQPGSAY